MALPKTTALIGGDTLSIRHLARQAPRADGNPEFATIMKVIKALHLKITLEPAPKPDDRLAG